MQTLSAVIQAHQFFSEAPAQEGFLIQNLDHENYLQKLVKRYKNMGIFKNIYVLVGDSPAYESYLQMNLSGATVVAMPISAFSMNPRYHCAMWNAWEWANDSLPVWVFQIMTQLNEEFLYEDSAASGFGKRETILKLFARLKENPGFYGSMRGPLGVEGYLWTNSFLKTIFHENTKYPWVLNLDFDPALGLKEFSDMQKHEFDPVKNLHLSINNQRNFQMFQRFYQTYPGLDENYFREKFLEFVANSGKSFLKSRPSILCIDLVNENTGEEMSLSSFQTLISEVKNLKPLSLVFNHNWQKHKELSTFLSLASQERIFIYLRTDGTYPVSLNPFLIEHCNVILFEIDDYDKDKLQKLHPQKNAHQILTNFATALQLSHQTFKPQIGIEATLPENMEEAFRIIQFWRNRTDYVPGISAAKVQGHIQPCIQFTRFHSPHGYGQEIEKRLEEKTTVHVLANRFKKSGKAILKTSILQEFV